MSWYDVAEKNGVNVEGWKWSDHGGGVFDVLLVKSRMGSVDAQPVLARKEEKVIVRDLVMRMTMSSRDGTTRWLVLLQKAS